MTWAAKTKVICDKRYDHLKISLDYEIDRTKPYPVLLYTPNTRNLYEHYHICLSKDEARELHAWLTTYLEENND